MLWACCEWLIGMTKDDRVLGLGPISCRVPRRWLEVDEAPGATLAKHWCCHVRAKKQTMERVSFFRQNHGPRRPRLGYQFHDIWGKGYHEALLLLFNNRPSSPGGHSGKTWDHDRASTAILMWNYYTFHGVDMGVGIDIKLKTTLLTNLFIQLSSIQVSRITLF